MKHFVCLMAVAVLALGFIYACGSSGSGSSSTGTVALYMTDDISDYSQVEATVTMVKLVHTGSGDSCTLFDDLDGIIIDIANLSDILQFVDTTTCKDRSYNRVHIGFLESVYLMNQSGTESECTFTSYKNNKNQPNVLVCPDATCLMNINGAVNVLARQMNPLVLDFDLKGFEVEEFGTPECRVTMKVKPLGGDGFGHLFKGYKRGVTGFITNLPDPPNNTFRITTRWGTAFTVDYSNTASAQPNLHRVLQLARDYGLKVRVKSDSVDVSGVAPIIATAVYVKASGRLSELDTGSHSFDLLNTAKSDLDIQVDYSDAAANDRVEGSLADDIWVEVKLYDYLDPYYLAHEVEVEDEDHNGTDD